MFSAEQRGQSEPEGRDADVQVAALHRVAPAYRCYPAHPAPLPPLLQLRLRNCHLA